MITLTWISLALIVGMVVYAIARYKEVPDSLSRIYYLTGQTPLFSTVTWISSFLIIPKAMELGPGPIPLFAILGLLLVGATPKYGKENPYERKLHVIGAVVAMICSQIMVGLQWYLLLWIIPVAFAKNKRNVLLAELTCYATIYIKLLTTETGG